MGLIAQAIEKRYRTSPASAQSRAVMSPQGTNGRIGKPSAGLYRNWYEHGDIVRAGVDFLKTQIQTAEWDIVQYDRDGRTIDKILQKEIKDQFENPNLSSTDYSEFLGQIVLDLIVLDAGVIEKERTYGGQLIYQHPVDGGQVYVNRYWDGDPGATRYWWQPTPVYAEAFKDEDMVYMMTTPRSYSPVGLSYLETLKLTIDAALSGDAYNTRQVQNAAPDGIMDLGEGARPEQVEAFRTYWAAEVAGRGAMAFLGGTKGAKFVPFRQTNRDMQFLEWEIFLIKKTCAVLGISPQDLGFTMDINRANGEVQQEKTDARGTRPLMATIQAYNTKEIVWDRSFGGRANNLAFRFTRLNIRESKDKADINKISLAGIPWKTGNEARHDEGRQPIGDLADENNPMNRVLANTPLGIVDLTEVRSAAEVTDQTPPDAQGDKSPAPKKLVLSKFEPVEVATAASPSSKA